MIILRFVRRDNESREDPVVAKARDKAPKKKPQKNPAPNDT